MKTTTLLGFILSSAMMFCSMGCAMEPYVDGDMPRGTELSNGGGDVDENKNTHVTRGSSSGTVVDVCTEIDRREGRCISEGSSSGGSTSGGSSSGGGGEGGSGCTGGGEGGSGPGGGGEGGSGAGGSGPTGEGENVCTYSQGYFRTHADWPADSTPMLLGNFEYNRAQLQAILDRPVLGNGLIALGHQLIAAKLNVFRGATDDVIAKEIAEADAFIGDMIVPNLPTSEVEDFVDASAASNLTSELEGFNVGPNHCGGN